MASRAPSVMIIAGEASGDFHGASLAAELRREQPDVVLSGIGGWRMREAGVSLLHDSSSWSAIGLAEALKLVPKLLRVIARLEAEFRRSLPDVLVLVDFGAFNIRFARRVRDTGVKIVYHIPPGSWNREATYGKLDGLVDRVITPFPWSAESLHNAGFHSDFFGHPLLDMVKPAMSPREFYDRLGLEVETPVIGLLPGSRTQEIMYNLPAMLIAAAMVSESLPEAQFVIPPASSLDSDSIVRELTQVPWVDLKSSPRSGGAGKNLCLKIRNLVDALAREEGFRPPERQVPVRLLPGMAADTLAYSRAAAVTSGSATVEALILDCPMVIIYRGSRLTALEYKLLGQRIKFMGMPNIILDREICPELKGREAGPRRIADFLLKLAADSPERARMLAEYREARTFLGTPGAVKKAARAILDLACAEVT